jgi:hypothetical protein
MTLGLVPVAYNLVEQVVGCCLVGYSFAAVST